MLEYRKLPLSQSVFNALRGFFAPPLASQKHSDPAPNKDHATRNAIKSHASASIRVLVVDLSSNISMEKVATEFAEVVGSEDKVQVTILKPKWGKLLREMLRADVIVSPAASPHNCTLAALGRLLARQTVIGIHDVEGHDPQDKLKVFVYNKFLSFFAHDVMTFSKFSQDHMNEVFNCNSLVYYFGTRTPVAAQQKTNDVVVFGRIKDYQGRDELVEVVADLPTVSFIVAGVHAPEELSMFPNVDLHSYFVPEDALVNMIARSKVAVFPYKSATQSGGIPMAIATGTHVVGYDVGGLAEQAAPVEAWFVKGGKQMALSDALRLAIATPNENYFDRWVADKSAFNKATMQKLLQRG